MIVFDSRAYWATRTGVEERIVSVQLMDDMASDQSIGCTAIMGTTRLFPTSLGEE